MPRRTTLLLLAALPVWALVLSGCPSQAEHDLFAAARTGRRDIALESLLSGANVNVRRPEDQATALTIAAQFGRGEMVAFLLENGAAVDYRRSDGSSALMLAVLNRRPAVVDQLLAAGADVELSAMQFGLRAVRPLHAWAINAGPPSIGQFLLAAGADVTARTEGGLTPIDLAVRADRPEQLEILLGPAETAQARQLDLAMRQAVRFGSLKSARWLLARRADPNGRDDAGNPLLATAVRDGQEPVARLLIEAGALEALAASERQAIAAEAARQGLDELAGQIAPPRAGGG
ncbi:MAG: ankyrin repeat domain-containing protein [Phycisphaerae bacterium]